MKRTLLAVGTIALIIGAATSAAHAQRAVLPPGAGEPPGATVMLPTPYGGQATAINQWGLITGEATTEDGWWSRAFRAWPRGDLQLLGTLGGPYSHGTGVNDFGDVTGESMTADGYGSAFAQLGSVMHDTGLRSTRDINNQRYVAGWTYQQAAVWSPDGVIRLLHTPSLPPDDESGRWWSAAFGGINDRGQVAGFYSDAGGTPHAVRWEPDGTITEIGIGIPTAINEAGDVVGWGYNGPSFLWRDPNGWTAFAETFSPLGLNDTGQVVGICHNYTPSSDACLWTEAGGFVLLSKPVEGHARAEGINDFGEIVGSLGEWDGARHALWWYEPPGFDEQLTTVGTLLLMLRDDGVINHGRHVALTRALERAEGAWNGGDRGTAAKWLAHMAQQLGAWQHRPGNNRLVHLQALVERLALRARE
jgi:uncharacterized membrane protein